MSFEPGSLLGTYEILAPVGSTGETYTASDTRVNRKVVLKMLPPEVSQLPEMTARLKREIEAITSLKHPHISPPVAVFLRVVTMAALWRQTIMQLHAFQMTIATCSGS